MTDAAAASAAGTPDGPDEVARLKEIIRALMDRAERSTSMQGSDYGAFQTAIMLEGQVRRRTAELQTALHENESINRALRESEAKFRGLVSQSLVGIVLIEDGRFVYSNAKFDEIFGYSSDEIRGMQPADVAAEDDRALIADNINKPITGAVEHLEYSFHGRRKDNTIIDIECHSSALHIGKRTLLVSLIIDVTTRKHAEAEASATSARLDASEKRFRALVQRSSDATLVCDRDGLLSYVSAASISVLGIDDEATIGHTIYDVVHPDDHAALTGHIRHPTTADVGSVECRILSADGSPRWVEMTFTDLCEEPAVGGVVIHARDITERQRLERELRHAQKLESIGQLAAGIAHEINTPLQYVGDNVNFLQGAFTDQMRVAAAYRNAATSTDALETAQRLEAEVDLDYLADEVPAAIEQTIQGLDRMTTIVRAMKAFGHPNRESKSPEDLNEGIRNTLIVANNAVKLAAKVHTELGDLPPVWCHISDINQVVLNLVLNAAQAITETATNGQLGLITVRTFRAGEDAVIEITDSGGGIPPEIAERIFEPFYTTKEVGIGTGQGLSIAYTLIHDRHGGSIRHTSQTGIGATFNVHVPIGSATSERHQ
jgi:PAS domain S-box-containing protein